MPSTALASSCARSYAKVLTLCLFGINFLPIGAASAQLRTIAVTGHQVPGLPQGSNFNALRMAGLNDLGQVALIAELETSATPDGTVVYVEQAGQFHKVASQGDDAPGAPAGFKFDAFPFVVLNDAGQTALVANYSPDGSGRFSTPGYANFPGYGLWSASSGVLSPIVLRDDPMPGTAAEVDDALFREFSLPAISRRGEIALVGHNKPKTGSNFCGLFEGPCTDGVWRNTQSSLDKLVVTGEPAGSTGGSFSGFPSAVNFGFPDADVAIALNDEGHTAFLATGGGFGEGLWSTHSGAPQPLILQGAAAPGLPTGTVFGASFGFFTVAMNNAGESAVLWGLEPGGEVNDGNNEAIWLGTPGNVRLVVREGESAPGIGTAFHGFGEPIINRAGDIAFNALLGEVYQGYWDSLWVERVGQLMLVSRAGDSAIGSSGAVWEAIHQPSMNSAGQIAFSAALRLGQGGITESNDTGIWAQDVAGNLRLIIREGDVLDVDDGPGVDHRTVSSLFFASDVIFAGQGSGNEDGRPSFFNDRGQLAFWAEFTDGSHGIFVSDLIAVPEPGPGALVTIVLWMVAGLSRRAFVATASKT